MSLKYNTLPEVVFESDKEVDNTIHELETLKINLINQILQPIYLMNMDDSYVEAEFDSKDYKINNKTRYNNFLVPGAFIGEPNHMGFDESAVIKLGRGNTWVRAVAKMGKWYEKNVTSCNEDKKYACDILHDEYEVSDTNLGFLKACLLLFAQSEYSEKYSEIKDTDFMFCDLISSEFSSILKSMNFVYGSIDDEHMYEIEYDIEDCYVGDITVTSCGDYAEIFFGEREEIERGGSKITEWGDNKKHQFTAMNWCNLNNNKENNYGMPCPIEQGEYGIILRYLGEDAVLLGAQEPSNQDVNLEEGGSGDLKNLKFADGPCPFAHIPPYKGIKTYDMRKVVMKPALTFQDLLLPPDTGVPQTVNSSKISYPSVNNKPKNFGCDRNNPCDISAIPEAKLWITGTETAADGQTNFATFKTLEQGLAAAMILLRKKYSGKSIRGINNGYQGYVRPNEEAGLSAARISWITHAAQKIGVSPMDVLDVNDKETLIAITHVIAGIETSSSFTHATYDAAYRLAFR